MNKIVILLMVMVLIAGCGEKKVDSTTDEAFTKSMAAIKESLSGERKRAFEESVQAIVISEIGNIFEAVGNPDGMQSSIKDKLHGMTADEIIAEGNRIIEQRRLKERDQAVGEVTEVNEEIAELQNRLAKTERDKEQLKTFKVVRSRFYFQESSFMKKAVIELTIKNETKYPVSRAYFLGVLATPGRSVPWVQDSFNYKIPGGLEPGEQATWRLTPNMFGEWSKAPKDRKDMVLTVTVQRIDGADEKAIFDSEFSTRDKDELAQLTDRLEKLKEHLGM